LFWQLLLIVDDNDDNIICSVLGTYPSLSHIRCGKQKHSTSE